MKECWVPRYLHRPVQILWFELPVYLYWVILWVVMSALNMQLGIFLSCGIYLLLAYFGARVIIRSPRGIVGHWFWRSSLGGWLFFPYGLRLYPPPDIDCFYE